MINVSKDGTTTPAKVKDNPNTKPLISREKRPNVINEIGSAIICNIGRSVAFKIDKEYLSNLENYDKLLKIRNKYLKENKRNSEEFAIYEKEFIKYASYIIFSNLS